MRTLDLDGAHVLIVDDEPDARELLRAMLANTGARISEADTAAEALRIFAEDRPDILLADVAMPVQDGYSLMRSDSRPSRRRRQPGVCSGRLGLRAPRGPAARAEGRLQRSRLQAGASPTICSTHSSASGCRARRAWVRPRPDASNRKSETPKYT